MKRMVLAGKRSRESAIWTSYMENLFAICVDNSEYPASLEMHKTYRVLSDDDAQKDGDLRVIDESGEDYLFPADYFVLVELPEESARLLIDPYSRCLEPAKSLTATCLK